MTVSGRAMLWPGSERFITAVPDDGRHLALVAYAAALAAPYLIAVIDSESCACSRAEGRLYFPEIQGVANRKLHIVDLTGR